MNKETNKQVKNLTSENFPDAFAAMKAEAREFWAFPGKEWQLGVLEDWAKAHGDDALLEALKAAEVVEVWI